MLEFAIKYLQPLDNKVEYFYKDIDFWCSKFSHPNLHYGWFETFYLYVMVASTFIAVFIFSLNFLRRIFLRQWSVMRLEKAAISKRKA